LLFTEGNKGNEAGPLLFLTGSAGWGSLELPLKENPMFQTTLHPKRLRLPYEYGGRKKVRGPGLCPSDPGRSGTKNP
jgi:hypothetical protein